ncbi:LOW QUALITY PROTEIN: Protein T04A11.11 [Phytophthora palmivora]|uniref:Protein T04A11.11 n=1 Tax=Phytophthora palmivora TaxID=4796 RepID=A0A2P4Y7I9_9STRA|nr:LOW QUALITY PROTEIN: Protein T04A11.11 [Phytophthora palmivora]
MGRDQKSVGSESEIVRRTKRSRGAVNHMLFGENKERKKPGPTAVMSEREVRRLLRTAAKDNYSAQQLTNKLSLSASVRTIRRVIAVYTKMDNTLPLSAEGKVEREEWAWARIFNTDAAGSWDSIIFSDEKMWNLDGPDGLARYPQATSTDQAPTGWWRLGYGAGFGASEKTIFAVLHGKQNSDDYVYTLSTFLLPFAHLRYGTNFVYQQNGAYVHRSNRAKDFLEEQDMHALP